MARQPTDQMSAAAVTLVSSMTSGAIQYGVPATRSRSCSPPPASSLSRAATPKSASFTTPCAAARVVNLAQLRTQRRRHRWAGITRGKAAAGKGAAMHG